MSTTEGSGLNGIANLKWKYSKRRQRVMRMTDFKRETEVDGPDFMAAEMILSVPKVRPIWHHVRNKCIDVDECVTGKRGDNRGVADIAKRRDLMGLSSDEDRG